MYDVMLDYAKKEAFHCQLYITVVTFTTPDDKLDINCLFCGTLSVIWR
jgi:hypothetical protein